jgi:hypothetical protein
MRTRSTKQLRRLHHAVTPWQQTKHPTNNGNRS